MGKTPPTKTSEIELQQAEAMVFPMLLDFMYCANSLPLSVDRACALYTMAARFGMPQLKKAIQSFIENALDFKQSLEFVSFARRQENKDKLEKLVLFANSKLCGYLVKHPEEAAQVPPDLLAHLLHKRSLVIKVLKGENPRKYSGDWELQRSCIISKVVAESCHVALLSASSTNRLSRKVFKKLIDSKNLPALDSEAALKLLQVDAALAKEDENNMTGDDQADSTAAITKLKKKLTYFEERCLHALAMGWRTKIMGGSTNLTDNLQEVAPHVLAELLVMVSKQYEEQMTKTQRLAKRTHAILDQSYPREVPRQRRDPDPEIPPHDAGLEPSFTHRYDKWCTEITDMVHILDDYDEDGDSYTNYTTASII
jgi:hypothetical protein